MSKILGLDLGTNSIGWAIRNKESTQEHQIEKHGVIVFDKGFGEEKNVEFSRAAERTKKRGQRKLYRRRKLRKAKLLLLLSEWGMCPIDKNQVLNWIKYDKGKEQLYPNSERFKKWLALEFEATDIAPATNYSNPYELRARALLQTLKPEELGRVFYHLVQRRGFKSNRKDGTDKLTKLDQENEKTGVVSKQVLKPLIEEHKTVGAALNSLNPAEVRYRKRIIDRKDLYSEFEMICEKQGFGKVNQEEEFYTKRYSGNIQRAWYAIFLQRPLRSQRGLVGKCTLEKKSPRCPISHPDFEEFRKLAFINNIKVRFTHEHKKDERPLNEGEKILIDSKFYNKSATFKFESIAKTLDPKGRKKGGDPTLIFNFKDDETVNTCPTTRGLQDLFGENWKDEIAQISHTATRNATKNNPNTTKQRNLTYEDVWHALYNLDDEHLVEWGKTKLNLNEEKLDVLLDIPIKDGYSPLSKKAINKITPYLKQGMIYSQAVFIANLKTILGEEIILKHENEINSYVKQIIETTANNKQALQAANDLIGELRKADGNSVFASDHTLTPEDKRELSVKIINRFGKRKWNELDETEKTRLTTLCEQEFEKNIRLNNGQGKFIELKRTDELIKEWLEAQFSVSDKKLNLLYHPSDNDIYKQVERDAEGKAELGSPQTPSIKNPMAMRTLHELRKLMNYLVATKQISNSDTIRVEMSRELNTSSVREAIRLLNKEHEARNEEIRKELIGDKDCPIINPTGEDILKWKLVKEQGGKCVYTGKNISICDLFRDKLFDLEHTWPRSQSFDNSEANLTICYAPYNRDVKQNSIPSNCPNWDKAAIVTMEGQRIEVPPIRALIDDWIDEINDLTVIIEASKARAKSIEDPEARKKNNIKKIIAEEKRKYWSDKVYRFEAERIRPGFKNSQSVDTQIIAKYSLHYLRSAFDKVHAVQANMAHDFKVMWGLAQKYEKKDRSKHHHHAADATLLTYIDKESYDLLAQYYREDEQGKHPAIKTPWGNKQKLYDFFKSFETNTIIVHRTKDNVLKQTKKKLRYRGKLVHLKDKEGNLILDEHSKEQYIWKRGNSIRASLHMDTIFGAIQKRDKERRPLQPLENERVPTSFVLRKEVKKLEAADIKKIVDPAIKKAIEQQGIENPKLVVNSLKGKDGVRINIATMTEDGLKELAKNEVNELFIKQAKELGLDKLLRQGFGVPIKRVRLYREDVKNPLEIRKHAEHNRSKNEYKQIHYSANEENYLMALYVNTSVKNPDYEFEMLNALDTARMISSGLQGRLYPEYKEKILRGKAVRYEVLQRNNKDVVLKIGAIVLMYEKNADEIWKDLSIENTLPRMFKIKGLNLNPVGEYLYGKASILHVLEAKPMKEYGSAKQADYKFNDGIIYRQVSHKSPTYLIEGIDFRLNPDGTIEKIE